jgi:hypothetical protein
MKKRLGRPPAPPEQVRGNRVVSFVTDDEFEELQAGAEQEQTSLSRYLHNLLMEGMKHHDVRSTHEN